MGRGAEAVVLQVVVSPVTLYEPTPAGAATSIDRPTVPIVPSPPRPESTNAPLPRLSILVPLSATGPRPGVVAPYGRLLRCQLVNTVDSAKIDTPIIALLTEDVWHDGQLVVPVGTEIHGRAKLDRSRERIVADQANSLRQALEEDHQIRTQWPALTNRLDQLERLLEEGREAPSRSARERR
ncbi:MAG: hypothetical protein ACYC23_23840 [Limisphaerales bacterium]